SRFQVLAIDLPGHGKSSSTDGPLDISIMAARVQQTLADRRALPAHVIGLSLGGAVAQALLIQSPESVRSLVLCGTTSEVTASGSDVLEKRARTVEEQGVNAIIDETM